MQCYTVLLILLFSYVYTSSSSSSTIELDIKKRIERQQHKRIFKAREHTYKNGKLIAKYYKHSTIITDVQCQSTMDCLLNLSDNSWCKSGFTCVSGYCHRIPDYPCKTQTEICDEEHEVCKKKSCTFSSDCNDHLYCNGREKCINRTCQIDVKAGKICKNGLCDEDTKTCIYPTLLQKWKNHALNPSSVSSLASKKYSSYSTDTSKFSMSNHGNHTHDNDQSWISWVVVAIIVVIFFVLVFLMIAVAGRGSQYIPVPTGGATWTYG